MRINTSMGVSANPYAQAAWVHYVCNVGGQTLYFMEENVYHILTVFNQIYSPATEQSYTDQFSSKEIKKMVEDHLGLEITISEIHNTMRDLKFIYIMQDNEFVWLVQKI